MTFDCHLICQLIMTRVACPLASIGAHVLVYEHGSTMRRPICLSMSMWVTSREVVTGRLNINAVSGGQADSYHRVAEAIYGS